MHSNEKMPEANDEDHQQQPVDGAHHHPHHPHHHSGGHGDRINKQGSTPKLIGCAVGIFVCYFYYGIIQEKIVKTKYGEEQEKFVYTQALVFVQCFVNALFAYLVITVTKGGTDDVPSKLYAACSFSYLAAMMSSNQALQYVPYPTQVLGKSCKPIPIMFFGVFFARQRYSVAKYMFVLLIVVGVSLFLYKDNKVSESSERSYFDFNFGEILLLFSLAMDGTTGAIQDRIRSGHKMKPNHTMLYMNLWSTLYLLVGLLITGEILSFLVFVQKFPYILFDMISFSFASALGQYFIFVAVADFGPLTCSILTTTRKFFTILASVLFFGHSLTNKQWLGTVLVFVGLGFDSYYAKTESKKPKV